MKSHFPVNNAGVYLTLGNTISPRLPCEKGGAKIFSFGEGDGLSSTKIWNPVPVSIKIKPYSTVFLSHRFSELLMDDIAVPSAS
jgi:hypothetical protein